MRGGRASRDSCPDVGARLRLHGCSSSPAHAAPSGAAARVASRSPARPPATFGSKRKERPDSRTAQADEPNKGKPEEQIVTCQAGSSQNECWTTAQLQLRVMLRL